MGRASIKIDQGDSHMSENWKDPYTEDKRTRAERRWKRREVMINNSLKHNQCASATKTTIKIGGNMAVLKDKKDHMIEDEIDEDYKLYLETHRSDIDSASDNNVGDSDIDVDTGYKSDSDEIDEDYKLGLDTYVSDIDNASDNNVGGSNIGVHTGYNSNNDDDCDSDYKMYLEGEEEEEEEEERLHNKLKLGNRTRMSKDLTWNNETENIRNTGSDSMREQTGGRMESQQCLETERGPCNKRPPQDVSSVPRNNWHSDVESDDVDEDYQLFLNPCRIDGDSLVCKGSEIRKSSSFRQNSKVSDQAFDTPEVQCEIDEDYQLFLNPARTVDGNLEYMPDKNTTKTSKVERGSNSSDSDLIVMEPNSICENTPFISSKTYWFENEMNPRDSRQSSAYDHSEFRRRLMEYLERPYDHLECDVLLHEVYQQKQRERHLETRQGVVKSYHTKGVSKSYLDLYPDLANAIDEFNEPHRVLFLLRGFIFWLQNLCHEGIFRPWLDESCLEILRKM